MLKNAFLYQSEINELFQKNVVDNPFYRFWQGRYQRFSIEVNHQSDWDGIERVSVDKNNAVLAYMRANFDRYNRIVESLSFVRLCTTPRVEIARDMIAFMDELLITYNFRKVNFSVFVGNPAEKGYDRFVRMVGGRVVGVYKDDVLANNGQYYDNKIYEIHRDNYKSPLSPKD